MVAKKTRAKERAAAEKDLESLVQKTLGRVTQKLVAQAAIHVEITDGGGQSFHVVSGEDRVQVRPGAPKSPVGIRISGPAVKIRALLDGRKHPSRVFVEGGIVVSGDVRQITALSEELPRLTGSVRLGH